jgi:hypothetical protein
MIAEKVKVKKRDTTSKLNVKKMSNLFNWLESGSEGEAWEQLIREGYCRIRVIEGSKLVSISSGLLDCVRNSPELAEAVSQEEWPLVTLGGFGALGTASSRHFPLIRKLVGQMSHVIHSKLIPEDLPEEMKYQGNPDRLCIRLPGATPDAEKWHRDIPPGVGPEYDLTSGDLFCGGWLNLSDEDQYLSCKPGTQWQKVEGPSGFAQCVSDVATAKVRVGPGELLVFNALMIHEVLANPAGGSEKRPYMKLFHGFRLTRSDHDDVNLLVADPKRVAMQEKHRVNAVASGFAPPPVHRSIREVYLDQGLPPLCSGQEIPQFSSNHYGFMDKDFKAASKPPKGTPVRVVKGGLRAWSKKFHAKVPRTNKNWTKRTDAVTRYFPSLGYLGMKFREYSESELQVACGGPRRRWDQVWCLDKSGNWEKRDIVMVSRSKKIDTRAAKSESTG